MSELMNVDTAIANILTDIKPLSHEHTTLHDALSRTLASDIVSNDNLPPFDNSAMDGYAIRAEDMQPDSKTVLHVVMDIPAGIQPQGRIERGQCARIMTGAPMPEGADTVVPVENTDSNWGAGDGALPPETVTIIRPVDAHSNVRKQGHFVQQGQNVLRKGITIRPQDIGLLASIGISRVPVSRQPRIAILTTGDELIDPDQPLSPGKIRDSNSYALAGLVRLAGGVPIVLPRANDNLDAVRALFQNAIDQQPDLILSSAGVSMGAADFVRTVLEELGTINLWRINLRPGKPLAYGTLKGIPFIGLPGNPVSAMVTFEVIVKHVVRKFLGSIVQTETITATTEEDIHSDGRRSFLRVTIENYDGAFYASTTGTQSSDALLSMVQADGLLIVPEDVTFVPAGSQLTVILLR